nr:endonuclease-reverse transcriptase [Nuttalliella namaqua]
MQLEIKVAMLSATWIKKQMHRSNILAEIKKWTWARHLMHRTNNSWSKGVMECISRERKSSWGWQIRKFAGIGWMQLMPNRNCWRSMGEAFVLQQIKLANDDDDKESILKLLMEFFRPLIK